MERARKAKREGKAPTTQAGEFVREEMEHIREGKHGARSTKQATAIGLSKARRADVKLKPPKKGQASARTRKSAGRAASPTDDRVIYVIARIESQHMASPTDDRVIYVIARIEPQHMRRRKTPAEQVGAWRFTCSPISRCHRQEAADEPNSSRMCVHSRARVDSDGRGSEPADTDSTSINRRLHRSYLDQTMEKHMNRFKSVTKPLVWSMSLLLAAFVAGCDGDGNSTAPTTGTNPNITVSGTHALDVASVLTGGGFIKVVNNGAHVAATQIGTGTIDIVNNGQVVSATNTGSGRMAINSNATSAVTVTRTGNGNTTVNATGSSVITLTYNGDGDVTYP